MASMDISQGPISQDAKYVCGWNYYTMKIMGIWPEERKWNEISSYIVLTPILTMLCFVCCPQTANLFYIWRDFDLVVENLSVGNMTTTISVVKTIIFWFNGRPLKSLLVSMGNDWSTSTTKREQERMLNIASVTRELSKKSTLMANSVVFSFVFLRFFTMSFTHRLLYRAHFPYDLDASPYYELTILGQFFGAMYAATTYAAVDTFVAMLVLHVCGQLESLRHELKDLHGENKIDFQTKLGNIVRKHEYLSRFTETIEGSFNMMLLIQMLGFTIQLCFQAFQAITSIKGEANQHLIFQFLFLLLYVVYVMLQLYLYCYVGERLLVESTEIAYAAYDCEWYNLSATEAKLLIIIMVRARSPLRITAGRFCSFTLGLYSQVLKTSMGYISVLSAMTA